MAPTGKRSFHQGPYHYCGCHGDRWHISELTWQRGILKCPIGLDTGTLPLVGDRDVAIVKALEVPTQELMPDPKLTEPSLGQSGDEDITF